MLLFQLPQCIDGEVGNAAVKVGAVRHRASVALGVAGEVGRQLAWIRRYRLVIAVPRKVHHLRHAPGLWVSLNFLPPIVEELADALSEVAVVFEMLRQSDDLRSAIAQMRGQIPNTQGVRPQTGHHRGARWVANRLLAIRPCEESPALGEGIDVWADHVFRPHAAQF